MEGDANTSVRKMAENQSVDNIDEDAPEDYVGEEIIDEEDIQILENKNEEINNGKDPDEMKGESNVVICGQCGCGFQTMEGFNKHEVGCRLDEDQSVENTFGRLTPMAEQQSTSPQVQIPLLVNCNFCDLTFTNVNYLQDHIKTLHGFQYQNVCMFCQTAFNDNAMMQQHIRELSNATATKLHISSPSC